MTATPNRRVQKLLDAATEHGWTVEHPTPELSTWLVYPRHVVSDGGFVVHGQPNDGARVVRADSYKAVTQREALTLMAAHRVEPDAKDDEAAKREATQRAFEKAIDDAIRLVRKAQSGGNTLDDIGLDVRVVPGADPNEIAVETEFSIPFDLPQKDQSDFAQGALLAATKVANLLERSVDDSTGAVPEEMLEHGIVTPPHAAHAYLFLANQVRDPKTLRLIFEDTPEPGEAARRGAEMVCKSLVSVWTAFADGLFKIDPNQGAPIRDFMSTIHEHAEFIRTSADEAFGPFITASDADFESLLGGAA